MLGPFLEVLIGGLLAGVLYSLVALGFVLIFKASGVFNFAQGAMIFFAGLVLVWSIDQLITRQMPYWLAVVAALVISGVVMAIAAWAIQHFVLGPLINKNTLIIFMATIGVTFVFQSLSMLIFGFEVHSLRLFPNDAVIIGEKVFSGGILINTLDIWGGVIAGLLVVILAAFFQWTKTGCALRAVADDHTAAQSVGIPIGWVWFVVWLAAGLVAIAAAAVWGTKIGVQYSIMFLALKALPVLMIGGLTSIPGAIIGGPLIGAGEKIAEIYLGPTIGGGLEYWFAYVLALLVLLVRPQGLFGERQVERV
jgi:branched-chain amino acid transport system permease protein